jgi:hypothetical protein
MRVWRPGYFVDVPITADEEQRIHQGYMVKGCCNPLAWGMRQVAEGRPWPWPSSGTATSICVRISNDQAGAE